MANLPGQRAPGNFSPWTAWTTSSRTSTSRTDDAGTRMSPWAASAFSKALSPTTRSSPSQLSSAIAVSLPSLFSLCLRTLAADLGREAATHLFGQCPHKCWVELASSTSAAMSASRWRVACCLTHLFSTLDTNESDYCTALQVDRLVEHDAGRADRDDQLLDPAHRAAGHLPR